MCDTTGSIVLNGQDISSKGTADIIRLGVAHVPQGRGTFAELSVLGQPAHWLIHAKGIATFNPTSIAGSSSSRSLASAAINSLALCRAANSRCWRRRRALMSHPQVLLLDEPSLGLAPIIVEQLFETLRALNKEEGLTMLLVEQNANLALAMADHGYVIEGGSHRAFQAQLRDS